jgi:long-chain acyl-CoA synthetase
MRGYLNRDDLTRKVVSHGWLRTGDIAVVDERGHLFLRGRAREEINKGGVKVYPEDVDRVIERFPGVVDACTFGYADPLYGEDVAVALVLETDREGTLRQLQDWTRDHLVKNQLPQAWFLLPQLPRSSRGKINRTIVATQCATMKPIRMPR